MADSSTLPRRGLMFILSSPSGAGKTTVARKLLAAEDNLQMSVSVTTRPKRPGEVEGRDYEFTDLPGFNAMVEADAFLEWAEVFGNCYGTPRARIAEGMGLGRDFLFDVDWQGTQQLYQKAEVDVVRVFILPPTMAELERRLRSRGTDSDEVIAARMARAANEISHWDGYDYVLINDNVDDCYGEVKAILRAERLKRRRQIGLIGFARDLIRSVPEADTTI